jgi:hypothetical protein
MDPKRQEKQVCEFVHSVQIYTEGGAIPAMEYPLAALMFDPTFPQCSG